MLDREDADRGAHRDAASGPEQIAGQGDRGRADAVGHEVVLGDPHVLEAGVLIRGDRRGDRRVEHPRVRPAGELRRQQQHAEPHPVTLERILPRPTYRLRRGAGRCRSQPDHAVSLHPNRGRTEPQR